MDSITLRKSYVVGPTVTPFVSVMESIGWMMAPFLNFMATAHVNSFGKGFSALARARQTGDWHERNEQVSKVGECSATIGIVNLAFLLGVIFQLAGIRSLPFPPIILWFIFFTGLVGFIVGFFLQTINNPGDHINLATATLFSATVGAVFAMGVFAATAFPPV